MLKRLLNLPFTVASKAARAYQEHEDAKVRAKHGGGVDPGTIGVAGSAVSASAQIPAEAVRLPVSAALEWQREGRKIEFVDVRDAAERAAEPGIHGAVHMPMDSINVRVSELSWEIPVIAYCSDGRRSTEAVRFFRERGMEDTYALAGGLAAWVAAGGAVDRR